MNTIQAGVIEAKRREGIEAIKRKRGIDDENDNMIELSNEYRQILNNPLYPLCRLFNNISRWAKASCGLGKEEKRLKPDANIIP